MATEQARPIQLSSVMVDLRDLVGPAQVGAGGDIADHQREKRDRRDDVDEIHHDVPPAVDALSACFDTDCAKVRTNAIACGVKGAQEFAARA
jgi:hypothetical protein